MSSCTPTWQSQQQQQQHQQQQKEKEQSYTQSSRLIESFANMQLHTPDDPQSVQSGQREEGEEYVSLRHVTLETRVHEQNNRVWKKLQNRTFGSKDTHRGTVRVKTSLKHSPITVDIVYF